MSTVARRLADEVTAIDKEAFTVLDTVLRRLFEQREQLAEHVRDGAVDDLVSGRVAKVAGPRGIPMPTLPVNRYGHGSAGLAGWVRTELLEKLTQLEARKREDAR